jgi:hypothetical protein
MRMSYEVTQARYRVATSDDEIPPGRVVTVIDEPGVATVIVRPGHATKELLVDIEERQRSMLALGQWMRLAPGTEPEPGQKRVTEALWALAPADKMPSGILCMPIEECGRHVWLIREGEASKQLVAELSELLTAMVRAGVWVQRWDEPPTRPTFTA